MALNKNNLLLGLMVCGIAFYIICTPAIAAYAVHDCNEPQDIMDLSLEELMNTDVVISASRQKRQITQSSVPVSVITAEEIHYSGLTNIPEILMLAPGVDVQRIDRNRYAVSIRGFQGLYSDRILVLINGRPAGDPVLAGINWKSFPVLVEDIDRIEIVRGPIGAAWGANAENGLINIITKKPADTKGGFVSSTVDEYGDSYTHARYSEVSDNWAWRLSAGYQDSKSSNEAGAGDYSSGSGVLNGMMGFGSFKARDFSKEWIFDFAADHKVSNDTKHSFGVAHSSLIMGDSEFVGDSAGDDNLAEYTRVFARVDHEFEDGSTGYLQWFGNHYTAIVPNVVSHYSFLENDIEAQYDFTPNDSHHVSVGGNFRWTHINITNGNLANESIFGKSFYDEYWVGLFLSDSYTMTDRITLENQVRTDYYSETDLDWSLRSSALYTIDDEDKHVLRFSYARAFRNPSLVLRDCSSRHLNGLFVTNKPSEELVNENSWSLEAGYTGLFGKGYSLSLNSFYQRYENILATKNSTNLGVTNSTFANCDGVNSYGAEIELALLTKKHRTSVWYSYNDFELDNIDQIIRAGLPSRNKAGVKTRIFLMDDYVFYVAYTYHDAIQHHENILVNTPTNHRLDLNLSKTFSDGDGEVMLGVTDVLNNSHRPNFGVGQFTGFETPGRTLFMRLQLKF